MLAKGYVISGLSWPQPGSLVPSVAVWDPGQESQDQAFFGFRDLGVKSTTTQDEEHKKGDHPKKKQKEMLETETRLRRDHQERTRPGGSL